MWPSIVVECDPVTDDTHRMRLALEEMSMDVLFLQYKRRAPHVCLNRCRQRPRAADDRQAPWPYAGPDNRTLRSSGSGAGS
jgi:hypothetical protein